MPKFEVLFVVRSIEGIFLILLMGALLLVDLHTVEKK
jgi:hypothetical protein